jgi:hypothetical protein
MVLPRRVTAGVYFLTVAGGDWTATSMVRKVR